MAYFVKRPTYRGVDVLDWQDVNYNTKEFWRRVRDMGQDLKLAKRKTVSVPNPKRNASREERAYRNYRFALEEAQKIAKNEAKRIAREERNLKTVERAKKRREERQKRREESQRMKQEMRRQQQQQQAQNWKRFQDVDFPYTDYDMIPEFIKQWSHLSGSFLYQNQLWDQYPIDFEGLVDGYDHTAREFLSYIFGPAGVLHKDIYYDPDNTGDEFFVYASEWNSKQSLSDDYTQSRRYL